MDNVKRAARALAELGFSSEDFDRLMVAVLVELRNLEAEDGKDIQHGGPIEPPTF